VSDQRTLGVALLNESLGMLSDFFLAGAAADCDQMSLLSEEEDMMNQGRGRDRL